MQYTTVIFDFDGTVADTAEGIFESIQFAMRALHKVPLERDALEKFIGPPLLHSFQEYAHLQPTDAQEAVELYRQNYTSGGLFKLRFYDGIAQLLQTLRENGIKTGLASAKPDVFIQRILKHYAMDVLFDCAKGISLEDVCTDKTDVIRSVMAKLGAADGQNVLMIGDTLFDIEGAARVGVASAAVLYGYGDKEQLVCSGADHIAATVSDLETIIFGDPT